MSVRKRIREGRHPQRKRAAKAKANAREAVVLLEQARELIAEDDAGQAACHKARLCGHRRSRR